MSFKGNRKFSGLSRQTTVWAAGIALSLSLCAGVTAEVRADNMAATLSKLEYKYFQHDYEKDEAPARLERLEKMVFGEARTGSEDERLKNLLALVPNLDSKTGGPADQPVAQSPREDQPEKVTRQPRSSRNDPPPPSDDRDPVPNDTSYPAITAVEKKLLGRDYIGESVGKRLDRLEIKAFGKTSASADLQDRLDRLKSTTGVDVARQAPANSDWSDEEDGPDLTYVPDKGIQPYTGIGEDGRSFSGRDLRKDFQQAMGNMGNRRAAPSYQDNYAGTGTFGAGRGGRAPAAAPSRGGDDRFSDDDMPPMAPSLARNNAAPATAPPVTGMGLSQQVALLEREVFKKTYANETIPARLNRLETTVFPQDKPSMDKALPDRMSRLLAAVPVSQAAMPPQQAKRPKPQRDPDFGDLGDDDGGMPPMAPQRAGGGGLSKIINGLGSMLSGGMVGGYTAAPGTLVTDPQTGFLYDQYTGTLIDPMTGAVVGRRQVGYGGAPVGGTGFGGFNSGFSPMSPYGMQGSGMRFGFGSGGVGLGWP